MSLSKMTNGSVGMAALWFFTKITNGSEAVLGLYFLVNLPTAQDLWWTMILSKITHWLRDMAELYF
jgi:hypothetical protein